MTPTENERAILALLPATRVQICKRLGFSTTKVYQTIKRLHADGKIHVFEYLPPVKGGGTLVQVFTAGPGIDCEIKFEPAKARRQIEKTGLDDDDYFVALALMKTDKHIARILKQAPATWFSGLPNASTITKEKQCQSSSR